MKNRKKGWEHGRKSNEFRSFLVFFGILWKILVKIPSFEVKVKKKRGNKSGNFTVEILLALN